MTSLRNSTLHRIPVISSTKDCYMHYILLGASHAYIYAGLLANRLTPRRCRGFPFIHSSLRVLLLGRGRTWVNIAHYQVYIVFIV